MEFVEDARPITVFLCFSCILHAGTCLEEIAALRIEERRILFEDLASVEQALLVDDVKPLGVESRGQSGP